MKKLLFINLFSFCFLLIASFAIAQSHSDPPYIQVVSAEKEITIDGELDETDWQRRFDYLIYGANSLPGDVSYTVTGGVLVDTGYVDTTTTIVMILRKGLDLYISLQSNDKYVCRRTSGWEGDGLFMKIKDGSGNPVEYKLYYNLAGADPEIHYEEPANYPGSGSGAGWKRPGTIVNSNAELDSGYTAEMVIHLDQLGYTDVYADVIVLINIFDPDSFEDNVLTGSYHKMWWGSEWGVTGDPNEWRTLRLADPPIVTAFATTQTITLDGQLNEDFWNGADSIVVQKGSTFSSGGYYMQWNNPNNQYTDQSRAVVKFSHNGNNLYIGVVSDDKSVCKWSPGWEADGLFLWMTNKGEIPIPSQRMEIKNMYFDATIGAHTTFELSTSVPTGAAEGASYEPVGTVTHTEVGGADVGYSLETVVHTEMFGYGANDTINLSVVIWDMDYSDSETFANTTDSADYAPNWWGTQWVDQNFEKYYLYRQVFMSAVTDVEDEISSIPGRFELLQNYPNPFNPSTTIGFNVPDQGNVSLIVYNILGIEVRTLVNEVMQPGFHTIRFDASDLASGIYFYELKMKNQIETKKMTFLK
jgi:hypothetical protein